MMFVEEDSVEAPLIENDNAPFGANNLQSNVLPHPIITLCHIGFRAAAVFFYILVSFTDISFIASFVVVILLLSADFWTVKNVTGRIMVGLRWWNYIDDDGKSHWVYESRKEAERHLINGTESKIFWAGLFLFPFLWSIFLIVAILTFKFKWVVLVLIALVMNGSNVYGYLKCKFGKSDKGIHETLSSVTSNFIREQVVQNWEILLSKMSNSNERISKRRLEYDDDPENMEDLKNSQSPHRSSGPPSKKPRQHGNNNWDFEPTTMPATIPSGSKIKQFLDTGRSIPLREFTGDIVQELFFHGDPILSGDEDEDEEADDSDADPDYIAVSESSSDDEVEGEEERAACRQEVTPLPEARGPVTTPQTCTVPSPIASTSRADPSPVSYGFSPPTGPIWMPFPPSSPQITPYTQCRQLKQDETNNCTPYGIFRLLFTDDFIDHIVSETNVYREHLKLSNVSPKSRIGTWKPTTRNEFLKFLGITFHTGSIKLNRLSEYWSLAKTRSGLFHIPWFGKSMPRDRYMQIAQALHFARNPLPGDPTPTDRLYKIRPVINHFNETMDRLVIPGRELSIDESMVLWRGRLSFRQYIQTKRHKYGMKLYVLAEPKGLALKFLLYAGSSDSVIGGPGHASNAVKALMYGRTGLGHSIYADNFYNSVSLTRELLDQQTYITGTLQKNRRQNPKDITDRVIKKGEMVQRFTPEGICVMKWRDKRQVLMISSEFTGDLVNTLNRRGRASVKPQMISRYNSYMSGIDRMDQMLAYYPCDRKSRKWYKKLAIHTFQMLLTNAHNIYETLAPDVQKRRMNLHDFRIEVIEALVGGDDDNDYHNADISTSQNPACGRVLLRDHHLEKTEASSATSTKGRHKRVTCRVCKGTTYYVCTGCPADNKGRIGLCPECLHKFKHLFQ